MEQNGGGKMNWTKIPTNLLISRTPDNELVAIVKYQLLWADLEYQPTDDIALRYMSNKQLALVKHYLNDIEAQVVSDIKLTVNHRGGQKTYYKKKQTLRQNTDNQNDSQPDSQRDVHTDGADKIRLDKINKKENIKKEKPDIFHSVFVIGGDDWKFSPECLKLAKKHWTNSIIRQIESNYSHRPPTEITIEKLLDEYPSDKVPYKILGEKKSIPLTQKQWEWFAKQGIAPAVKVKAIDLLEEYAVSNPKRFKQYSDLSIIIGRGWAYREAFKEPYKFENQEHLVSELKRVGLK